MELHLSWDIVFVIIFVVVFGITLIRSQKFVLRLLFGTYISLIVSEGAELLLEKVILPAAPMLQSWVSEREVLIFMSVRIIFFLLALLLFLVRGHYHIAHKKHDHWLARLVIHTLFALLTSLLFSISIFAFLSGNSLIDVLLGNFSPNDWFDKSLIVEPLLKTFGIWFILPAVGMWLANIFGPKE